MDDEDEPELDSDEELNDEWLLLCIRTLECILI